MAPPSIIRIRLDLRNIRETVYPSLVWLSVDTTLIHTVEDLQKLIVKRINIVETDVNLYCQDCYLPSDETIAVIRDEDLLRIYYKDQHAFVENKCDPHCSCFTSSPIEKGYKISHKKRKRYNSEVKDLYCDNKSKRYKSESGESSNNVIIENACEEKRKKKHRKHKVQHSESNAEPECDKGINDALSICTNNDCSENIKKKRKKHSKNTKLVGYENNPDISIPENTESIKDTTNSLQQIDHGSSTTIVSADKVSDSVNTLSRINQLQHEGTDKSPSNNCKKKRKRSRKRKNKMNNNLSEDIPEFEIPSKESLNKEYLESSYKSSPEHKFSLPVNKHIKFTNINESDLIPNMSSEEKSAIQSTLQGHSFTDGSPFATLSPLEFTVPKNGIVSSTSKQDGSESSVSPKMNSKNAILWNPKMNTEYSSKNEYSVTPKMNLVATIQSRYKEFSKTRQLSSINTNKSTVFVNKMHNETFNGEKKKENEPVEKKDYKKYSILKGPPRIGDLIAYKILELSADYCPQMSDYKEGRVICYNDDADDVEVELTTTTKLGTRNIGKFDLPNMGNNLTEESAGKNIVTVNWAAMVEPRLIS